MPFLFLCLVPFLAMSFIVSGRAYLQLTPDQQKRIRDRRRPHDITMLLTLIFLFIAYFLVPTPWDEVAISGFYMCSIAAHLLLPRPPEPDVEDPRRIPASYEQQVLAGNRWMWAGQTLFILGCIALALFSRK